jgi:PKD repeat protein
MVALAPTGCQYATDAATPSSVVPASPRFATVPPQGTASSLDVGNWNIEWFGDPANGPANDALQLSNVKDVISGADLDIWGLEEVVDTAEWNQLKAQLPGYTGILANEPIVVDGPAYYSGFSNTEQKVAILYKSSVASLLGAKIILTANDYDFAGRPPMEVRLRATLNGGTEDIVVIVLHNKCCSDATSWQRRQNASVALKNYLDATYPTQKVWVIGDWNDDTDVSITAGSPTPWANFLSDPSRYTFPTKALSDAHVSSSVSYPDFIDHQLYTNEVGATYVAGSASVLRADTYIPSYGTTTTDHYPVYSRYDFGAPGAPATTVISPNGGESWQTSSVHDLTWTSANVANVKLDYTLDGGTSWTEIVASTAASAGRYSWTLPSTTSTNAKVRVSDVASSASDISNASFTITNAPPPPPSSIAAFTYTCSALTCSFNASTSTGATSYAWNFGDGTTGTGVTASHKFAARKNYAVTLTTSPSGTQSSASKTVTCNRTRCS